MYKNLLGQRNEISLLLSEFGGDEELTVTTFDLTEGYLTVDFRHYSRVRRITCLEELGDTRQTGGDITAVIRCTCHREEDRTDLHGVAVVEAEVCLHRQVVRTEDITTLVHDMRLRHLCLILGLGNEDFLLLGSLIDFGLTSYALDDVLILDETVLLDDKRCLVRIPFADHGTLRVFLTRGDKQLGSVVDIEGSQDNTGLLILEVHGVLTAYDNRIALFGSDGTQVFNLHDTFTRQGVFILCSSTSQTTGVESTQCQLSTRLTDSLCSDDTDSLTFLNHLTGSKVTSVALRADTVLAFASEY